MEGIRGSKIWRSLQVDIVDRKTSYLSGCFNALCRIRRTRSNSLMPIYNT